MHPLHILLSALAFVQAPAPSDSDVARWEREAQAVTIVRDDWGIAHIHGKTDADAVFGMIYAQAEDDFNRVETNYLNSLGRLAEAEGESAIYSDLRQRLFVDPVDLKIRYGHAPVVLKKLMQAWADSLDSSSNTITLGVGTDSVTGGIANNKITIGTAADTNNILITVSGASNTITTAGTGTDELFNMSSGTFATGSGTVTWPAVTISAGLPTIIQLGCVSFNSVTPSEADIAEAQVKVAEQQRILGLLGHGQDLNVLDDGAR